MKKGIACVGVTWPWSCSAVKAFKYCFKDISVAGFPTRSLGSHSSFLPDSLNKSRSFPIRESTVPYAKRIVQEHEEDPFRAKKGQEGLCTLVFPFLSFQTRKRHNLRVRGLAVEKEGKTKRVQDLFEGRTF